MVPRSNGYTDWTITVVTVEIKEVYREDLPPEPEPVAPSRYERLVEDDDVGGEHPVEDGAEGADKDG